MQSKIIKQIYIILSNKNKIKLYDDWGIDSAYDLEKRIIQELEEANF